MKLLVLIFTLKNIPVLSWSSFDPLNLKPKSITLIFLILGLILFGLGETLLITANAGVSPWTVLAQGISVKTGYSIGITTFIVSISVLCLWIPLKQRFNIGTVINILWLGTVVDVAMNNFDITDSIPIRVLGVVFSILMIGVGTSIYVGAGISTGPRDGVMVGLEQRGLTIIGLKLLQMDNALASKHYSAHVDKPFFGPLVEFITSGPIVAIALQGKDCVAVVRNTMGSTNPVEANLGTIRGDFGIDIGRNLIHGSDSVESAQTELGIFFDKSELLEEYKDISSWVIES